jgi:hypothetical protein
MMRLWEAHPGDKVSREEPSNPVANRARTTYTFFNHGCFHLISTPVQQGALGRISSQQQESACIQQ